MTAARIKSSRQHKVVRISTGRYSRNEERTRNVRRFGKEEDAAEEDETPEHLETDWDTPRRRVVDGVCPKIDDVGQEDAVKTKGLENNASLSTSQKRSVDQKHSTYPVMICIWYRTNILPRIAFGTVSPV